MGGPATVSQISPSMNIGGNNAATPAAPTGFTATAGAAGSKTINLAWTDVANNNAGYTVQSRYRLIPGLNLFSAWTTVTNAVTGDASSYARNRLDDQPPVPVPHQRERGCGGAELGHGADAGG